MPGTVPGSTQVNITKYCEVFIMAVARVTEIISASKKSFEDAIEKGIERSCKTLDDVKSAWIKDQKVDINKGQITEYRVTLLVTFILRD